MNTHIGQYLPDVTVYEYITKDSATEKIPEGLKAWRIPDLAHKKRIVAIGVIGAFIPDSHVKHVPDFIAHHQDFIKKGVDELWCLAVNDVFVMNAWGESLSAEGKMRMLSDGSKELVTAMDVTLDLTGSCMGVRSERFVMVLESGKLVHFLSYDSDSLPHVSAEDVLAIL